MPVEKCGNRSRDLFTAGALTACSACAGDYEDPDRTAWRVDENENADDDDDANPGERPSVKTTLVEASW